MKKTSIVKLEERTARLTILIDPRKKVVLERLCAEEDLTPSQVVRQLIREYIERRLGRPWIPGEEDPTRERDGVARSASKRRVPRP
jgi:ribbon-helix-helix protein